MSEVGRFVAARIRETDVAMRAAGFKPAPYLGPLWLWRIMPTRLARPTAALFSDHPDYRPEWKP